MRSFYHVTIEKMTENDEDVKCWPWLIAKHKYRVIWHWGQKNEYVERAYYSTKKEAEEFAKKVRKHGNYWG